MPAGFPETTIVDRYPPGMCLVPWVFTPQTREIQSTKFAARYLTKVQIDVGEGKVFTIIANNNSKENLYIQSATLNGKPYHLSWLHHNAIMEGGELIFEMGPVPNRDWGKN